MARRSVLGEIPIPLPKTEQQSYVVISEEEEPPPYNQPTSAEHPHAKYISNDESKENITPTQWEDIYKEQSQVKTLDSDQVGELGEPVPSCFDQTSDCDAEAENMCTPKKEEESSDQPCNTLMDFSTVTVNDLGISSESFTTKCAGKSPKSLHKHRRRSTIGVRGSPEMNFLIRQIALSRINRKSEPDPLESPFTSPRNSLLREKISAFRNAFQVVEETEGKLSLQGVSEVEEELESEKGAGEAASEPPDKRKRLCESADPGVSSASAKTSVTLCPAHPSVSSQKPVPEKTLESDCSLSGLSTEVPSKSVEVQRDETQILPSSSRYRKRKVMFTELLSPPDPKPSMPLVYETSPGPALKPALKKTPISNFLHFRVGFREENKAYFSFSDSPDTDTKPEDSIQKKKKVTFGRELSPELFDKLLPANTPVRRGSTPYNHHNFGASPSAELSSCQSLYNPMPQPDFEDIDEVETLKPLPFCFDAESWDGDCPPSSSLPEHKEESGPKEEEETTNDTRSSTDDYEVETSPVETTALVNESFLVSPTGTKITLRSNKPKLTNTEQTPERNSSKVKVRLTAKNTRKLTIIRKPQIKPPNGKGKKRGRKSKKSVQKPASIERDVVSKKPVLSPIPELPECFPTPPASMSQGLSHVMAKSKGLSKKVRAPARAGKVRYTREDPPKRDIEEQEPEQRPGSVVDDQTQDVLVDPVPEDVNVSNNGSLEKEEHVFDLAPVTSECPPSTIGTEVTDQLSKPVKSILTHSSVEKSKTNRTKRRSSSHRSVSLTPVTSEMTVESVRRDETVNHKPEISIGVSQQSHPLSSVSGESLVESTTASSSKLPMTINHKKSRRSSRNPQVSDILSATSQGENGSNVLAHPVDQSDSSLSDFCLPIDEVLQFPQQDKKVRRSMRLRRDSGVIGLSWVQENGVSDTTQTRKSLSSVSNFAPSLENTVHSPDKENVSSFSEPNIARKNRRRTLGTTTIKESVPTCDTKRRRSNCLHKVPEGCKFVYSALVQDS